MLNTSSRPCNAWLTGFGFALCLLASMLSGCGKGAAQAGSDATARTVALNEAAAEAQDLDMAAARADAQRGFIAAPKGQVLDDAGKVIWDFDAFVFETGKAPPTVHPGLWRQALLNDHTGLFKVTDGIYQLRGFDNSNITLIEGRKGWIVIDTLTTRETAAHAMAFARKHLGNKAVSAIVFTHSHIDHFGGALGVLSADEARAGEVPIVAPQGFMEEATSENVMAGIAMGRRAKYMYGDYLERSAKGLVDIGNGKAAPFGSFGILPPNQLITGASKELTLDGVRFVFYNAPGSEAPSEMSFYLPDHKAYGGAELAVQTMHNIYTLRGTKVRDALKWGQYLDEAARQAAGAEVYFAQHHWPVWGQARIAEFLGKHRDVLLYTHDQTVRLLNAGKTMNEIAEELKLPKTLDSFMAARGYYGTLRHNAKAVYQFYLGWFDANPAHLDPLPPQALAARYVELAGGPDQALAAAQRAFDKGDYRWSAELLNHLVFARSGFEPAKALLARTYDQLGYVAESAPWRNFYLSGSHELRNGPPKAGVTMAAVVDLLTHTPVERFLEKMAASIDGPKAADLNLKINLVLSDIKESHVLTLSNAVLHHRQGSAAADANATLTLTKPIFIKMITGTAGIKDTLLSDDLRIEGSKIDLVRFFSLIEKSPGTFAIVTPP